jgi:hypothetical protein
MTLPQSDFAPVAALDLDQIKIKLMHNESGEGWSMERANAVEFEYRRFLYLMKKYPAETAAPCVDVDTFWHYHILDTVKYAADCEKLFGYFLHHFPYVGLQGEEDENARQDAGERMRELYEATFEEAYIRKSPLQLDNRTTYCLVDAKQASSQLDGRTSYCMVATKQAPPQLDTRTAYCMVAAKQASPQLDMRTAYCMVATKQASPQLDMRTAYCMVATKQASPQRDTRTGYCMVAAKRAPPQLDTRTGYCMVTTNDAPRQANKSPDDSLARPSFAS